MTFLFTLLILLVLFTTLLLFMEYKDGTRRRETFKDGKMGEGIFMYNSLFAKLFLHGNFVAITIGKLIFVRGGYLAEATISHELRHVVQYNELGFFRFLWEYYKQHRKFGYKCNVFEVEARLYANQEARCNDINQHLAAQGLFK